MLILNTYSTCLFLKSMVTSYCDVQIQISFVDDEVSGWATGLAAIVARSMFQTPSVQQTFEVMRDEDFIINENAVGFFKPAHTRLLGSQIVEECFNVQKNSTTYENRRGCIEACYNALIEGKPLSTRMSFDEVEPTRAPVARDIDVPKDAFKMPLAETPKEFHAITGFTQKTAWHTCKAEDWCVAFGDPVLTEQALAFDEVRFSNGVPEYDVVIRSEYYSNDV